MGNIKLEATGYSNKRAFKEAEDPLRNCFEVDKNRIIFSSI